MSAKSYPATSGGSGGQHGAPNRSQRSPERPRGKSKRTLIESACTACQKRKSRCDGQRPACSRCQALHTDCRYHAEEGESRWSALRRRNQTLERERDEARDLLAQMQTRPEPEANQIYQRIRTDTNASDLGTLIHDVASALSPNTSQQNQQQHEHSLPQQQQDEHRRRSLQHQPYFHPQQPQQQQQHDQVSPTQQQTPFTQPNYTDTAPGPQLPPLRSVVGVPLLPPVGPSVAQRPLPQPFPPSTQQRHMSMGSGVSNGSYSSLSSSDGRAEHSLSPRDDQAPTWAHGYNQ